MYFKLNVEGMPSRKYKMEFEGRFCKESKIDFIICDTESNQVIFENLNSKKDIPAQLYKEFYRLFKFNLELSWLNWPLKGALKSRVETALAELKLYETVFEVDY